MVRLNTGAALAFILLFTFLANASEPNWGRDIPVPAGGRTNPYALTENELRASVREGRLHALNYPVSVSAMLVPEKPVENFLSADSGNPMRRFLQKMGVAVAGFKKMDDVERWLGLHVYPQQDSYEIPFAGGSRPAHRMGYSPMSHNGVKAFSISCAECHSSMLFGRQILGMTNRFPRANEAFTRIQGLLPLVGRDFFQWSTEATDEETALFERSKFAAQFIRAKKPEQLGLDTSLAQVALSLAARKQDAWATRDPHVRARYDMLEDHVADSKPAVWWNAKYKSRFLSDGSVVSGNPIYTNFIWNEVGRGTDLHELDAWFASNPNVVRDLTNAVLNTEAPHWTEYFAPVEEASARRGEAIFLNTCARCHGVYEKAWSAADAATLTLAQRQRTRRVLYPNLTRVIDVGTDSGRYVGMKSLTKLNALEISQRAGILIEPQKGYVPPPLVGIWARWPYFHNNSVPSLCAVLTPAKQRPKYYWAREANDPAKDFDAACNGYPSSMPKNADWDYRFDTRWPGREAKGHDDGIFIKEGREILSAADKTDLIRFLQTL